MHWASTLQARRSCSMPCPPHITSCWGTASRPPRCAQPVPVRWRSPTTTRRPGRPAAAPADVAAARACDTLQNRLFTDPVLLGSYPDLSAFGVGEAGLDCVAEGDLAIISAPIDGLGVNYYMPTRLSALPDSPLPFRLEPIPGYPVTAFGWPVIPAGLTDMLTSLRAWYGGALPPVYVTENGCSQQDVVGQDGTIADQGRIDYLDAHIRAVRQAIDSGVDVRGYFEWTLTDNFEWSEGYHQRFGLVYTDFETQRRIPKASFAWYRDMIAAQLAAR